MSVAALIAFVEAGSRNVSLFPPPVGGAPSRQQPSPPRSTTTASKPFVELHAERQPVVSSPSLASLSKAATAASTANPTTEAVNEPANGDGLKPLPPHVVPLTSKWTLVPSSETDSKPNGASASIGAQRHKTSRHNNCPSLGAFKAGESIAECTAEARQGESKASGSNSGRGGRCTALIRHLGAALGRRGKEGYRRPGSGQPVWRKRETLIQERIVQYTTLDEEGTVSAFHRVPC